MVLSLEDLGKQAGKLILKRGIKTDIAAGQVLDEALDRLEITFPQLYSHIQNLSTTDRYGYLVVTVHNRSGASEGTLREIAEHVQSHDFVNIRACAVSVIGYWGTITVGSADREPSPSWLCRLVGHLFDKNPH